MDNFTQLEIDLVFELEGGCGEVCGFDALLDAVLDELEAINRKADYVASVRAMTATFTLAVADQGDDELIRALTDLRTALHAAACNTRGSAPMAHHVLATRSTVDELLSA